jgi:hypothetical protein
LTICLPDPLINKRAAPAPILSAIRIDKSRPITTVTQAILIPTLHTIQVYQSWSVIPVELSIIICNLIPSVLKGTSGINEREYVFPGVKFHLFFTLEFAI